jgi:N-acetylmuramoyl-L-alanine amidase
MRVPRARFLHILAIAPVAAMLAGVLGPTPHALAAAAKAPVPFVVTVDPGHGGEPTPAHPSMPFDTGVIGTNGILEKDLDLDVGTRLAALLRADLVAVVMTRTSDTYVSVARREQISIAHKAALLLSVQASSSASSGTSGAVVRYATASSVKFAQTLSDGLRAQITPDGMPVGGVSSGGTAWAHNPVAAAIVDVAYLSNPSEAALLATATVREDIAVGIRNGIEAYLPAIVARRDAILTWRRAHPGTDAPSLAPASAAVQEGQGFRFAPLIEWLLGIALVGVVLLWRDQVARVLVVTGAVVVRLVGSVAWLRRAAVRRRRRRLRGRAVPMSEAMDAWMPASSATSLPEPEPRPAVPNARRRAGSVYDDIPL